MPEQLSAADFPVTAEQSAQILGRLLDRMDRLYSPSSDPQLVFVTGQPAAGKSRTIERVSRGMDTPAAVMDSDALRLNHPQLDEIMAADPQRMDVLSNGPVGGWMGGSLDHARQQGYNTILENTLTNPSQIADTAATFHEAGYQVDIAALAVPEEASRLGVLTRYLAGMDSDEYPRWTTEASHSRAYSGMVDGLEQITGAVDLIEVTTRAGEPLYAGTDGSAAAAAVREHRAAPLSVADAEQWIQDYTAAAGRVVDEDLISEVTSPILANLAADAQRIIPDHARPAEHYLLHGKVVEDSPYKTAPLEIPDPFAGDGYSSAEDDWSSSPENYADQHPQQDPGRSQGPGLEF